MESLLTRSDTAPFLFSPIRGYHYLIASGNVTDREIFLGPDDIAPPLGIYPLIPYFEEVFRFPFTWKSLMTEQDALRRGLAPLVTYETNITTTNEAPDVAIPQKMCLVQRSKNDQHYLRDREVHPFMADIVTKDSSEVKVIFKFTVQILDMKLLMAKFASGNFLQFVEDILVEKISARLRQLNLQDIRGLVTNDPLGIRDDVQVILKEINRKDLKGCGFKILRIINEALILPQKTQERINEEQQVAIEEQKVLQEKQKVLQKKQIAEGTKAEKLVDIEMKKKETEDVGGAEAKVLGKKLSAQLEYDQEKGKIIDVTKVKIAQALGKVKGTLVLREPTNSHTQQFDNTLDANIVLNRQQHP